MSSKMHMDLTIGGSGSRARFSVCIAAGTHDATEDAETIELKDFSLHQNTINISSLSGLFLLDRRNRQSMPVDSGRSVGATGTK